MGSRYCYPGTDTLINKLDERDPEKLEKIERDLSGLRLAALKRNPPKGALDLSYLQKIHRYMFQDIYSWAGEIRDVNISKDGTTFCFAEHIRTYSSYVFGNLEKMNFRNCTKKEFVKNTAWCLAEINAIHPFREGNGRTQRFFIEELARRNGRVLDFSRISKDEFIKGAKEAMNGNNSIFEDIISRSLADTESRRQRPEFGKGLTRWYEEQALSAQKSRSKDPCTKEKP